MCGKYCGKEYLAGFSPCGGSQVPAGEYTIFEVVGGLFEPSDPCCKKGYQDYYVLVPSDNRDICDIYDIYIWLPNYFKDGSDYAEVRFFSKNLTPNGGVLKLPASVRRYLRKK